MAGLSIVSEEYGRAVLADPSAIGLIAHELAHQWWGNMVTCQAWTEFWLNEGFATFMAAAYREHRFGRDVYVKDVASMKARYEQVRERGNDRALIFHVLGSSDGGRSDAGLPEGRLRASRAARTGGRCGVLGGHPPLHQRAFREVGDDR